ncbi:MAG TPA: response regulator [Steroidobacteraceae bacterium]|nr:response regulator [Steroidobacteraceae bacterium]
MEPERDIAAPIRVLIVEDSVVLRMSVAHYLRGIGYSVIESGNAQDALDVIASGIQIDLVFTDIDMPGDMDGQGLADLLAVEHPDLPVILTSGDRIVTAEPASGAVRRFLQKPYDLLVLQAHVEELTRPG